MVHQHCFMISILWTDWESLIEVHENKTLQYRFLEKHGKVNRKGKSKHLFFMTFYHLKAYKGVGVYVFYGSLNLKRI